MATDYVLFIHGVRTGQPTYADDLVNLIRHATPIQPLVVFWGDVGNREEEQLFDGYQASHIWNKLWFKGVRTQYLLPFAGDAALYLSRYIGAKVAERVAEQVEKLKDCAPEDRLHLVTHSMGTVILFDLLFSSRWDDKGVRGHDSVMAIRDAIYGVTGNIPDPKQGVRLGSITTMGSPIGIFSLMDTNAPAVDAESDPSKAASTHDITPSLVKLLEYLHQELGGGKLPWRNFVHPGDAIASPLGGVLPGMVDEKKIYIDIQDILTPQAKIFKQPLSALLDGLGWLFSETPVAVLDSGNAHGSYWHNPHVVKGIRQLIRQARA